MGFNRGNTTSTLFNKMDRVLNLIVEAINGDEETKRLLLFLTTQPLATKSVDYNNNVLYQNDVPIKLTCPVSYKVSKDGVLPVVPRTSDQILFPYPSEDSKITSNYCTMFVYNWIYSIGSKLIDTERFKIDILIPLAYLPLHPYGENRLHKIMERLAYLFDKVELDDESKAELGDLKFQLVGNCVEEKINKTNDIIITSLYVETQLVGARTDYTEGILR